MIVTSEISWLMSVSGVRGTTVTSVLLVMYDDGPRVWVMEDLVPDSGIEHVEGGPTDVSVHREKMESMKPANQ